MASDSKGNDPTPITDEQSFELAKLYFAAAKDAADTLDSRLFWSVGGIAALSAFAAKELVKLPGRYYWLLISGWGLLLAAILCLLVGYLIVPSIHFKWAKYWLYDDEDARAATQCPRGVISALSIAATAGVVLGGASVIAFVAVNVVQKGG